MKYASFSGLPGRNTFLCVALGLVVLTSAKTAHAELDAVFLSSTGGTFNYELVFNTFSLNGTPAETLPSGSFFTLYDIPGLVSMTTSGSALVFTPSAALTGVTPVNTSPTDSSTLYNATFTYTGPTLTTSTTFTGFGIFSTDTLTNPNGQFASQETNNTGTEAGTPMGEVGKVVIPAAPVPEPGSLLFLTVGAGAFVARRRFARSR